MTMTPGTAFPEVPEDRPRSTPSPQAAPSTSVASVDAFCQILARIAMRMNAEQAEAVDVEGDAQ